ncbi:MAG: PQQ-dependent sugar dehydrogenase [Hyphomonadaceae bacterium]
MLRSTRTSRPTRRSTGAISEPQADGTNNTAVAKGKLVDGAQPKIESVRVIYHQVPSLNSPLHFGSRLVFAKDGTLFVTQGERSILPGRMQAQDLKSGLGKIVRINTDGSIPKDNPFVGGKDGARAGNLVLRPPQRAGRLPASHHRRALGAGTRAAGGR